MTLSIFHAREQYTLFAVTLSAAHKFASLTLARDTCSLSRLCSRVPSPGPNC